MMNTQGLESPNQKLEAGMTDDAIFELDRMRAGNPNDPRILALLGRAYSQKGQMDRATNFFRMAMRMGRTGGDQTRLLNSYLLDMTRDAGGNSWSTTSRAMTFPATSRGKVYAFYADWADQCTGMSTALNQLTPTYSDRVDITRVNIQNAGSESLVDQFNVGPIPTVVFVSPSGKVVSTIIGESNLGNYDQAFKALTQTR
jgi:tetratricopeptide (TPR) repeat protein